MHGFGPVRAGAERAAIPRADGRAACWRCSAPWDLPDCGRSTAAAPRSKRCRHWNISPIVLLPALVSRARAAPAAARPRRRRRDRRRPFAAPWHAAEPHPDPVRCRQSRRPAAISPARPRRRRVSRTATGCARETSTPSTHTRLPRYARGKIGMVEAIRGCHVFPDTAALGSRREPAMALHGRLFGARTVGRGRRPRGQGLDRGVRALSAAGMSAIERAADADRRASFAAATARCSASRGRRTPSPWRWRCIERGLFTWPEWAATLADEIKRAQADGRPRHRRDLLPALARRTRTPRRRKRRHRPAPPSRAIATPGSAPRDAPRTAPRSR